MTDHRPLSDAFLDVFLAAADAGQTMAFDRFMELALYHPEVGYYRSDRKRIGFEKGTDFFTATTRSPVFGELIIGACTELLQPRSVGEFSFVEVGAETAGGVLDGLAHPFASVKTCRIGEPLQLAGPCVVFSNELFDAQPFRRFISRGNSWRELGVRCESSNLREVELPRLTDISPDLLPEAPSGYIIDAPLAATALARELAAQPWTGLFVACDYGKSWRELVEACPAGTARAYHRHTQSNDLLARPGDQDITCHICWDWLVEALKSHGFQQPLVQSQESFFVRHAAEFISQAVASEAQRFSSRKLSLLQLLHPAQLGQKFQVLHARRDE